MNRRYRDHDIKPYTNEMPKIIQDFYRQENYALIEIKGFEQQHFPMPFYKEQLLVSKGIDFWKLPLKLYANGFLDGYHSNLIPSFGDERTRKKTVFKEIRQELKAFSISYVRNEKTNEYREPFIQDETIYENGFFEGRRYKAWEIIFDTPIEFIELFEAERVKATLKMVERKYKDIANHLFFPKVEHTLQTQINFEYIDLKNNESPRKGNSFYQGFIEWMTKKFPDLHDDIFNRVKEYCEGKIEKTASFENEINSTFLNNTNANQMNNSFYSDIAHNLYVDKTNIGATKLNAIQYIEVMHKKSEFQGIPYYQNLIYALVPHWGSKVLNDFFKRLVKYCNDKIKEYPKTVSLYPIDAQDSKTEIIKFSDIFNDKKWAIHVDALTQCKPQLLKKEKGKYKFVGNEKTEMGCVASYFKHLNVIGVLKPSLNRNDIARVLNAEIENYKIGGTSIENISKKYKSIFKHQLESK